MNELTLRTACGVLRFFPHTGETVLECPEAAFTIPSAGLPIRDAALEGDSIIFHAGPLHCRYTAGQDFWRLGITAEECGDELLYPAPAEPIPGDRLLVALGEGVSIPVEEPESPIPERLDFSASYGSCLSFWGILRGEWGLLTAVYTPQDATLLTRRGEDGLLRARVAWLPELGRFGGERELRFSLCHGITALCKAYRAMTQERGLFLTLSEKARRIPCTRELAGAVNLWLWNDDAMDKLYAENAVYTVPTDEAVRARCRVAQEMRDMGMTRVLWSDFDENTGAAEISLVRSLGYLTTFYDVYTDVIPTEVAGRIPETRRRRCAPRQSCYPDGVIRQRDGSLRRAWPLKGTDGVFYSQNRLCERAVLDAARAYVSSHSRALGLQGRFLDVTFAQPCECWDPRHPATRTQNLEDKRALCGVVTGEGLFCGTEMCCEDAVPAVAYNEGMLSIPGDWRARDSGRRMCHLYDDPASADAYVRGMLNPLYRVPLWELVYHDCMVSYWYWGDSHNCCPALMDTRDLFCLLYGQPPLFSFRVSDWPRLRESVARSYAATVPFATAVGGREMTAFEYVHGDAMVQRTVFDGGYAVTVDFRTGRAVTEGL